MIRFRCWRARRARVEDSERAIAQSERLSAVIDMQRQEAAEVSRWARERLRTNHLTEIFLTTRGGRTP